MVCWFELTLLLLLFVVLPPVEGCDVPGHVPVLQPASAGDVTNTAAAMAAGAAAFFRTETIDIVFNSSLGLL